MLAVSNHTNNLNNSAFYKKKTSPKKAAPSFTSIDFSKVKRPIEIFDNQLNKPVEAILQYNKNLLGNIKIFDTAKKPIGSMELSSSHWRNTENTGTPHLHIGALDNLARAQYSGIGSKLIQTAVEISKALDAKGRLFLYAYTPKVSAPDPFLFYRKMGLSTTFEPSTFSMVNTNSYIKEAQKQTLCSEPLFIKLLEKISGIKFYKMSADEKLESTYKAVETIKNKLNVGQANKKIVEHTTTKLLNQDKLTPPNKTSARLGFGEWMYLNDNAVDKIWSDKISQAPILKAGSRGS